VLTGEWHGRTLSVKGDGVGMSAEEPTAKHGLGAGIVKALARRLLAQIDVAVANPGAAITLSSMKSASDGDVAPAAA
jgi:two-component sensor histidine kinase